jgi:CRP-like cAMP-binding protein
MKLCLGLYPRFFKKTLYNTTQDTEGLIYKEGDEVQEIYFILSGEVSAGY